LRGGDEGFEESLLLALGRQGLQKTGGCEGLEVFRALIYMISPRFHLCGYAHAWSLVCLIGLIALSAIVIAYVSKHAPC